MAKMIQFWDMDHTIINNDCDVSWKDFVIDKGMATEEARDKANFFYRQYLNKCLDIDAFLRFQLEEFKGRSEAEIDKLCQQHCDLFAVPNIYPEARALIQQQQRNGDIVCLITATNRYVARPLARNLNIEHILATELEIYDGKFTGSHRGTYCCAEGKLIHMDKFCKTYNLTRKECSYYGDSSNDIVILKQIGHPRATNPSGQLREVALRNNWPIIDFQKPCL